MNLLPKSHEEFSQQGYWDSFFKKRGNKAFEWYGEYPELCQHLHKYMKVKDEILIVGCGNSTLSCDLYDVGYKNITNIDISHVVIRQMLNLNATERSAMKFLQMDALNMSFDNEAFSVILDKGTLDALMPDDKHETINQINKYFHEISRVLKSGGRYLCISLLQEHILKKLVNYFPDSNWMFRIARCHDAEKRALDAGENSMPVFLIVCTKFKKLPSKILEINLGIEDKMQRLQTTDEIIDAISNTQKAAIICSGLKRGSIADQNEITLDLFKPGENIPRYTVVVIDTTPKMKQLPYAAFIVPQGRESEWLFSTTAGRKNLLTMTNHTRLTIVTMHRGQEYESLEHVQNELNEIVKNLAPKNITEKIPFLSFGSDVGNRIVVYEGTSEYSGKYVIEDVKVDGNEFRRLYFLNSQLVIQSEAKLKTGKSRKGNQKALIDFTYLTCHHHIFMTIATYAASVTSKSNNISVIGLGGGGLCMFLRKFLPKTNIIGIDIDDEMLKIAKEWFNLKEDENFKTEICDGIQFLTSTKEKYSALLFDVDNKDTTVGMSCPPKEFLEPIALSNVVKSLSPEGLFILNAVLRDLSLRPSIITKLKEYFSTIVSYKLDEDLNEIFICTKERVAENAIFNKLAKGCVELNEFFKRNNTKEQVINKEDFLKELLYNV